MRLRYFLTEYCGANFLLRYAKLVCPAPADELVILVYHNIRADQFSPLEKQLAYLNEKFAIVAPDILERPEQYANTKKTKIVITFDDGFASQSVVAQKILRPLKIKALFFIPTGFIDQPDADQARRYASMNFFGGKIAPESISTDMLPMTWHDVSGLVAGGHTVGAHTINHCRLTQMENIEKLRTEIVTGGERLWQRLGVPITHFAAPYGHFDSFNEATVKIVAKRYAYCHTSVRGGNKLSSRCFFLLRETMMPDEPLSYVEFVVNGGLKPLYRWQGLLLREMENKIEHNVK